MRVFVTIRTARPSRGASSTSWRCRSSGATPTRSRPRTSSPHAARRAFRALCTPTWLIWWPFACISAAIAAFHQLAEGGTWDDFEGGRYAAAAAEALRLSASCNS
jgi:hypothetical protein